MKLTPHKRSSTQLNARQQLQYTDIQLDFQYGFISEVNELHFVKTVTSLCTEMQQCYFFSYTIGKLLIYKVLK